jgi:hypothetical protein
MPPTVIQSDQCRFEMGREGPHRGRALCQLSKTRRDAAEVDVRFIDRRNTHGSRSPEPERRSADSLHHRWQTRECIHVWLLESRRNKRRFQTYQEVGLRVPAAPLMAAWAARRHCPQLIANYNKTISVISGSLAEFNLFCREYLIKKRSNAGVTVMFWTFVLTNSAPIDDAENRVCCLRLFQ